MLIRCGLLLAILSCVRTRDDFHSNRLVRSLSSDYNRQFSLWPSVHNAAKIVRIRRESQVAKNQAVETQESVANRQGPSEGLGDAQNPPPSAEHQNTAAVVPEHQITAAIVPEHENTAAIVQPPVKTTNISQVTSPPVGPEAANTQPKESLGTANKPPEGTQEKLAEVSLSPILVHNITIADNGTTVDKVTKTWDLSNPDATKRGLIVFGGFALLAMAYFIFYRTKSKYNETNNLNGAGESNQFRYGVLKSDDRRDNLELSRVPLTMESDDEEDEDLEIFDLEEKKKSLSYVNLQTNDEDIVLSPRHSINRDNLLLDIEDGNSDILINWSNNGSNNKSIL